MEDDDLLETYTNIWDKVSANIENNLIASLPVLKNFWEPKYNLMVMKLQIFKTKKFLRWILIILV